MTLITILNVIKNILAILPILFFCLRLRKVNLKAEIRGRQFLMPAVAAGYSIAMMLLLEKIIWLIRKVFDLLIAVIPIEFICNFLERIKYGIWMFYIVNYLFFILWIIVKKIVLVFLKRIWGRREHLMSVTAGLFYEFDEDCGVWVLQERWRDLRQYFGWLYIAAFVISLTVVVVTKTAGSAASFRSVFYPGVGIILIGEIAFFLGGVSKPEYLEDIFGEEERAFRVYNYSALRGALKNIFGDRIIHDRYADHSENEWATFGTIDEMMESSDRNIRNAGKYFNKLKMKGSYIDMHYVRSSLDLCGGKSVLINNPFYRDLTDYLVFVMLRHMLAHKKVLIIAGRDGMADDLKEWMDESFFVHMNITHFWKTEILAEDTEDWDIGILQFSQMHNLDLQKRQKDALADVGFVLFIEPSRIMATAQIGLSLLLKRCEEKFAPVYCACDRNSDGTVDALSHLLKVSITEVSASGALRGRTSEIYWQADGPYMHHLILPDISRYLGVGSEIAAAAVHMQVSKAAWLGSEKFPVCDMKWILGQYYQSVCKYTGLPVSQEQIYERIAFQTNLWQCDTEKTKFLIVEDEFCNMFEAMRLFGTRATNEGVVNIICEEYLLRSYMLEHAQIFQGDPKAIPSVVPDYARTEKNVLLRLLMLMAEEPVAEEVVVKELRLIGIDTDDVYETLQNLFRKHCSEEALALKVLYREHLSEDLLRSVNMKYYELGSSPFMKSYMARLKNAYFVAEDEEGRKHFIGARLYGHVFQMLLPGQFFTYAGKYYEVMNITEANGVVVRRAADHIVNRQYYRQHQTIRLSHFQADEKMGTDKTINSIRVSQGYAQVSILTHGYYQMLSNDDIEHAKYVNMNGIPVRTYHNKSVLKLDLEGASQGVKRTICIVLSEMFRTIYPDTWSYIHVTCECGETDDARLPALMPKLQLDEPDGCIYFIEDSEIDMGLLVSIERNIRRYLEFVTEFLTWHADKMAEEPEEEQEPEEVVIVFEDQGKVPVIMRIRMKIKQFFKKTIVPESVGKKKRGRGKGETEEETGKTPTGANTGETGAAGLDGETGDSGETGEPAEVSSEPEETAEAEGEKTDEGAGAQEPADESDAAEPAETTEDPKEQEGNADGE